MYVQLFSYHDFAPYFRYIYIIKNACLKLMLCATFMSPYMIVLFLETFTLLLHVCHENS